ncbi:peptidyl-prolyl cis-trans isomerase [Elysia marginata]|uniref:Peptidyl-prolyl cis-trans isomerase n=1 Tax=Elysia marginata TaxID=1093978 RepID=A0AAV4I6Q0_9GAST|nr:peptidyl-prolyl cis-trans isomerase [Elysia marginata]
MAGGVCKIALYGLINDVSFIKAKSCVEDLYRREPQKFQKPLIEGMLQFDWDIYIEKKRKELRGEVWAFQDKAIAFVNDELLGGPEDLIAWAEDNHCFEEYRPEPLYDTLTEEAYKAKLNSQDHDHVFLDITIMGQPVGTLVIELYSDLAPKTCANFLQLCSGEKDVSEDSGYKLTYENTLFHRIVRNGWIQGGDIYHGRGNGGESVYGPVFEDENFILKHNERGIVGMANRGRHTNGSQFYITLQPSPWMDTKYVAFGKVIEGTEVLKLMEQQETMNERPNADIKIVKCGIIRYEF